MTSAIPLLRAAILAILPSLSGAVAHEGHDHGDVPKPLLSAAAKPRVEAASGPFELVGVLREGELVIYVDRVDSNAPVPGAAVSVETPDGPVAAAARDDTYRLPAPWAKSGSYDLIFTIASAGDTEVLAGTLVVPSGSAAPRNASAVGQTATTLRGAGTALTIIAAFAGGFFVARARYRRARLPLASLLLLVLLFAPSASPFAHEAGDRGEKPLVEAEIAQRLDDGSLFVPKRVQRLLRIRTVVASEAGHRKSFDMPGRIIPDPGASGFVQASVSGRISAPENGFPKLGTRVKAGDLLAFVTPPFQAIDVSDMRQKAGELEQQISIVERRIERYETLTKTGAVTKVALDEAILELKGLRERRVSLDKVRGEPERLVAPVPGVIAAANAVAGQIAEINAVVFQIVEPARLWIEALTFGALPDASSATALTGDGRSLALRLEGAGLTDRSQAVPVHFSIAGDTKGLRVGQLVTVLAPTGDELRGMALPRASILRAGNGQTVVFVHGGAERFQPRLVRTEPLDAASVLIVGGLEPGARVVSQGAELLNQMR